MVLTVVPPIDSNEARGKDPNFVVEVQRRYSVAFYVVMYQSVSDSVLQ